MKTLKQLRKDETALQVKLVDLRDLIQDLESDQELPKLKKQYLGKYFKFRNHSGEDSWWLYIHILDILDKWRFQGYCFEVRDDGEIVISPNGEVHGLLQKEIACEEFESAYNKMITLI